MMSADQRQQIKSLAKRYPVTNLRAFDAGQGQCGVLVDPLAGTTLFDLGGLYEDLSVVLGTGVLVVTPAEVPRRIRDNVLASAQPID